MTTNNSPADGSTVNVAQALVTSASGQPMPGVSVTWNVGNGHRHHAAHRHHQTPSGLPRSASPTPRRKLSPSAPLRAAKPAARSLSLALCR
ncbi:Ig-like domain-containing protein [Cronobacter sakazakii]|uniref:Ig-like domain-containing protein n=1 Tax=Cronobacter sakazakii TaxID=28141 RepID=UPI00387B41E9